MAEEHVETLMIGYTHTQQAQPTTLAHYFTAATDVLSRDMRRLMAAYENCNRSSMGAAALTTSGFAISRERMMELLGFEGLIENSYDAIAGADYIAEAVAAIQVAAIDLGRMVQDFLLWCTQEFAALKVAAPYVQISSIMPQKRNPVSFEHARALISSCVGNTQVVLTMIHNTPFGDIVDTEDDILPYIWKSMEILKRMYRLLANVIGTLEVNKEVLKQRTKESFATVTELADTLVRADGLSFRNAHHVVSSVVRAATARGLHANEITLDIVNEQAVQVIGRKVTLSEQDLRQALDPEHFVAIRTLPGGPGAPEMRRMISKRHEQQGTFASWVQARRQHIESMQQKLDTMIERWSTEA
jgi:argininosuccinate lyase